MLSGELTGLRARAADDVEILHAELYEDVATRVRADTRPWVPIPSGPASPYWVPALDADPSAALAAKADSAIFSVVELTTGELAGEAVLWAMDLHNRSAHVGISLRPAFRGRGFGVDGVRLLCRYGFQVRGLRRLQLETLSDNEAMIAVANKLGFTREGMTRSSSWVNGRFCDDVIFGLLAEEFTG
jgi:RimJ/RimL family protein N-acetyltransferase